jgi:hypothetical protein
LAAGVGSGAGVWGVVWAWTAKLRKMGSRLRIARRMVVVRIAGGALRKR